MKKQLVIIGIVSLLVSVGLSGCESTSPDQIIIKKVWTNHVYNATLDKLDNNTDNDWFTFNISSGIEKWRVDWNWITFGNSSFTIYEGFHNSSNIFASIEYMTHNSRAYDYNKTWNTTYTLKINQVGICRFMIDTYGYVD